MSLLRPIRSLALTAGVRPMKLVGDEERAGGERYVCPDCEDDPLHDPAARKWVDGPLRLPAR